MGSRDTRTLSQHSRRDRLQERHTSAPCLNPPREAVVSPSEPIEAVAMLEEPASTFEVRDVVDHIDGVTVCGELYSAQSDWATEVSPLGHSVEDNAPTPGIEQPVRPVPPDRSRELAELQQQLGAKDELISALVGELEQVVEQLDRMQRSGANRSPVSSGGVTALPTEIAEGHHQVLGDLQRVVQQWEALQASSVLGRIEAEVGELRSMLARGAGFPATGHAHPQPDTASDVGLDDVLSRLAIDRQDRDLADMQSEGATWEAMKRQMMGGDAPTAAAEAVAVGDDEFDMDDVVAPHPVDVDHASRDELQQACVERDACIVQLTRLLRSRRAVSLPDNWDDILEVPEEQKARVDQLATRLEEQVRLAEVEMSLERARLSRERTQLQTDQEKIDKHLKRLGLSSLDELETVAVENGSTSDRRWMRFLGVNRRG